MKTDKKIIDWQKASQVSWKSEKFPPHLLMKYDVKKEAGKLMIESSKGTHIIDFATWSTAVERYYRELDIDDRECIVNLYNAETYNKQNLHDIIEIALFDKIVSEEDYW